MKKIYSCLLALALVLLTVTSVALPAAAEGGGGGYIPEDVVFYEENGFQYVLLQDGTAMITAFLTNDAHIVIPDTLGGRTVTEIAGWDFYDNPAYVSSNTVSVSLPRGIRALGGESFAYANRLSEIIVHPDNTLFTTDENGVLFNQDKTELVCYPAGKTNTKYIIPEGTRKIADCAFLEALNLKDISLPASLESFNPWYFSYCHHLESISVSKDNPFYSSADGVLFNKAKTVLYVYPCQNPRTTYYVPNTVTELAHGAFSFSTCSNKNIHCTLTSVYIPNSVQTVRGDPFLYWTAMGIMGYPDPIETLTVYLENGSPLQTYCTENGIACAQWDGKVPTNPDETKPAETDPTVPPEEATKDTASNTTTSAENTAIDIPKTAGNVNSAVAGAVTMLAFSAVVFLRRKKQTV